MTPHKWSAGFSETRLLFSVIVTVIGVALQTQTSIFVQCIYEQDLHNIFNRTCTFLHKNTADMKKSSCFRVTSPTGLSQTISNWMQQSSSWDVNMCPATQEQRVLRQPNFRQFNVFTTFRHWHQTPGILMGFTPSHPVSYISILPATTTSSRRLLQIF